MAALGDELQLLLGPFGDRQGWQDIIALPTPAPGANLVRVVDGAVWERVLAIRCRIVTSAVVANRGAQWRVTDAAGNEVIDAAVAQNIAAIATGFVTAWPGSSAVPTSLNGKNSASFPDMIIPPGYVYGLYFQNLDTGLTPPTGLGAAAQVGGGTFAAGTYYWRITGTDAQGETTGSNEATAVIVLNGSCVLTWNALPAGTTGVKVYRGVAPGGENALIATLGAVVTYTDTGTAGVGGSPPLVNGAPGDQIDQGYLVVQRFPTSAVRTLLAG